MAVEKPSSGLGTTALRGAVMRQMILFFSHQLTPKQEREAIQRWGITSFVALPPNVQQQWSMIEPHSETIEMNSFYDYIRHTAQRGDVVLVQGDYGATLQLVRYVQHLGCLAVYATAIRGEQIATENDPNHAPGEYKHCRFRRYV